MLVSIYRLGRGRFYRPVRRRRFWLLDKRQGLRFMKPVFRGMMPVAKDCVSGWVYPSKFFMMKRKSRLFPWDFAIRAQARMGIFRRAKNVIRYGIKNYCRRCQRSNSRFWSANMLNKLTWENVERNLWRTPFGRGANICRNICPCHTHHREIIFGSQKTLGSKTKLRKCASSVSDSSMRIKV